MRNGGGPTSSPSGRWVRRPNTAEDNLELVALATVADLVPLLDENRRLVRAGLAALASTAKAGLRALMGISRTDPSALDAGALAFRLAPRINAAGRPRRPDAGLELLLCTIPSGPMSWPASIDAVNAERRAVEERTLWEAEAQVAQAGPGAHMCSPPMAGTRAWWGSWPPGSPSDTTAGGTGGPRRRAGNRLGLKHPGL